MPRYLLDTQCLIWFQGDNLNISSPVLQEIIDDSNHIYFSQISLFEIAIKQRIGKLQEFQASIADVYNEAITQNFFFYLFTTITFLITETFLYYPGTATRLIGF